MYLPSELRHTETKTYVTGLIIYRQILKLEQLHQYSD